MLRCIYRRSVIAGSRPLPNKSDLKFSQKDQNAFNKSRQKILGECQQLKQFISQVFPSGLDNKFRTKRLDRPIWSPCSAPSEEPLTAWWSLAQKPVICLCDCEGILRTQHFKMTWNDTTDQIWLWRWSHDHLLSSSLVHVTVFIFVERVLWTCPFGHQFAIGDCWYFWYLICVSLSNQSAPMTFKVYLHETVSCSVFHRNVHHGTLTLPSQKDIAKEGHATWLQCGTLTCLFALLSGGWFLQLMHIWLLLLEIPTGFSNTNLPIWPPGKEPWTWNLQRYTIPKSRPRRWVTKRREKIKILSSSPVSTRTCIGNAQDLRSFNQYYLMQYRTCVLHIIYVVLWFQSPNSMHINMYFLLSRYIKQWLHFCGRRFQADHPTQFR